MKNIYERDGVGMLTRPYKFYLILFLIFPIIVLKSQTHIAVVEFEGKNVSEPEASALTDRLRTELFRTGKFRVLEREMMDEILKEQGMQQTGCTSTECIVEVGRIIGVEKMVGGSISKVGTVYSISAKIVSVETGEIIVTATYDHIGELGDLLRIGMTDIAYQLAGSKVPVAPTVPRLYSRSFDPFEANGRARRDVGIDLRFKGALVGLTTAVGCALLLNPLIGGTIGIIGSYVWSSRATADVPNTRIKQLEEEGKSPEFISAYRFAYEEEGKKVIKNNTLRGSVCGCCIGLLGIINLK